MSAGGIIRVFPPPDQLQKTQFMRSFSTGSAPQALPETDALARQDFRKCCHFLGVQIGI